MQLDFRMFRSEGFAEHLAEKTAEQATEFASTLRPEQLVNVTHVLYGHVHLVTVWYWRNRESG